MESNKGLGFFFFKGYSPETWNLQKESPFSGLHFSGGTMSLFEGSTLVFRDKVCCYPHIFTGECHDLMVATQIF